MWPQYPHYKQTEAYLNYKQDPEEATNNVETADQKNVDVESSGDWSHKEGSNSFADDDDLESSPVLSAVPELVCRLCSSSHPGCTSLLSPTLQPMIACLPVHISPSDPSSLPPLVCPGCLAKLENCHHFFCQVYNSHIKLLGEQSVHSFFKQDMSVITGQDAVKEEPEEICEQKLLEADDRIAGINKNHHEVGKHWMLQNETENENEKMQKKVKIKNVNGSHEKSVKKSGFKLRLLSLPSLTTCTKCGAESTTHLANLEHWRLTHTEDDVVYSCREAQVDSCMYSTKSLADMRDHLREHLFKQGKIGQCEICAKYFPKGHLKTHIKMVHEGVKSHECKTCQKSFKTRKMLQAHEMVHEPDDVRYQFSCHVCGRRFTQRGNLDTHLKNHLGVKPYKCDTCEKAFLTSSALKAHNLTHTGEKPFLCESCDAKFSSSSQLKNHVMVKHLNVHRYQCTYCPVKYNRLELLRNHEMSHTGETPFKCSVCGKGFRRKDKLKIHAVLHGSDEDRYRYPCEVCGKRFTQSNNLKTHMKSHHSDAPELPATPTQHYPMTPAAFASRMWPSGHLPH
eukprot:TRINITY_DN29542_c0_g1_i1.p1 TRINITY_DN29542_c0_g1~~TRINITY_DN29542_c0_g1_i1.p1  ORF type:complete len:582 (-),score=117.59 TRINITY_DN29542_c0_g1_i1:157-1854(-)